MASSSAAAAALSNDVASIIADIRGFSRDLEVRQRQTREAAEAARSPSPARRGTVHRRASPYALCLWLHPLALIKQAKRFLFGPLQPTNDESLHTGARAQVFFFFFFFFLLGVRIPLPFQRLENFTQGGNADFSCP